MLLFSRAANRLTVAQREFADMCTLEAMDPATAYDRVFRSRVDGWERNTKKSRSAFARRKGQELLESTEIQEYITELKVELAYRSQKEKFLSMDEKRAFLAEVVRTPIGHLHPNSPLVQESRETRDGLVLKSVPKLDAIRLDAQLAGELSDRVRLEVSPRVLELAENLE